MKSVGSLLLKIGALVLYQRRFAEEAKTERYQLQIIISESGKKGDAMCGKNKKALTDCL